MPCYHPLRGFRARHVNESGKRGIVFDRKAGFVDQPVEVPCGQCIGCRLERSRQWAMRCYHESKLYEDNCFVTLTYNDESLPEGGTLVKKHFQDFMKRLRFSHPERKIRYFHCGEYGETTFRPHYHAILFNLAFEDQKLFSIKNGFRLYTSDRLERIWGHGFATVGSVTFDSAGYCARYIMKKVTGDDAEKHYQRIDPDTGEIFAVEPEYCTMSRRPGIGKGWLEKYKDQTYPSDTVVINGAVMRPPKFYDSQLSDDERERIKHRRMSRALEHAADNTLARLRVRQTVKEAQIGNLKRSVE